MALKNYNPTSPARRGLILVDKSGLFKGRPIKALTEGKRKSGGRNNMGHATARGIAGGHKQKYRFVDFKRRKWDQPATVERLEYDPNRAAFIASRMRRREPEMFPAQKSEIEVSRHLSGEI